MMSLQRDYHALSPSAVSRTITQIRARSRRGLHIYRVVRRLWDGSPEFPGAVALHANGWQWGVQGELLWSDRGLAQAAADARGGHVEDVTSKYVGMP